MTLFAKISVLCTALLKYLSVWRYFYSLLLKRLVCGFVLKLSGLKAVYFISCNIQNSIHLISFFLHAFFAHCFFMVAC